MWNKINYLFMISVTVGCMALSGCEKNENAHVERQEKTEISSEREAENLEEAETMPELQVENVDVRIPGLENKYKFIFMSDLHIIVENEEINEESLETVRERYDGYVTQEGYSASELWGYMPSLLEEYDADAVFLGGDMIDYASSTNVECLKNGVNQFEQDVIYVRADHDYAAWYNNLEGLRIFMICTAK